MRINEIEREKKRNREFNRKQFVEVYFFKLQKTSSEFAHFYKFCYNKFRWCIILVYTPIMRVGLKIY